MYFKAKYLLRFLIYRIIILSTNNLVVSKKKKDPDVFKNIFFTLFEVIIKQNVLTDIYYIFFLLFIFIIFKLCLFIYFLNEKINFKFHILKPPRQNIFQTI